MKLKAQEVEKEGMNKELYDLFIELIQFEYNKMSFLKGAKFYCWAHGLQNNCNFFCEMYNDCSSFKGQLIWYLLTRFEEIPDLKIDKIRTEYESVEEVFTEFAKQEEDFVELLENIASKAKELNDISAMAYILPQINNVDHIACRALEAVRNDKNPFDLINCRADYYKK